ncbi:MAG: hypothetical protein LUD19_03350 [Clostridia bacterium]|nr:hypothetical protein [Clostridia bacterium]
MLKNGQTLNKKAEGTQLIEVELIPKGTKEAITVYIYAKNTLDASNYLILNKHYGKQLSFRYHTAALLK